MINIDLLKNMKILLLIFLFDINLIHINFSVLIPVSERLYP